MIKVFSRYMSIFMFAAAGLTTLSQVANAQTRSASLKQCPAINCDCGSIEGEKWKIACQRHEARIKRACVDNGNTPKDYCSVHGLAAKPLPLSIEFSEFRLGRNVDVKGLADKKDSLLWLITSDTEAAAETFKNGNYPRTLQILKLVESNIDSLFEQQQKLESAYLALDEQGRAASTWKKSANGTLKNAEKLLALGTSMANRIPVTPQQKQKKIFTMLSKKVIRLSGLSFEHAGYAYGRAERQGSAAKAWGLAANASEKLLAIDRSLGLEKSVMKFNELQAAARMHRMSYHFMLDEELENATDALKASQVFVNREEQQFIGDLVNALEISDEDEGVLSGR